MVCPSKERGGRGWRGAHIVLGGMLTVDEIIVLLETDEALDDDFIL